VVSKAIWWICGNCGHQKASAQESSQNLKSSFLRAFSNIERNARGRVRPGGLEGDWLKELWSGGNSDTLS